MQNDMTSSSVHETERRRQSRVAAIRRFLTCSAVVAVPIVSVAVIRNNVFESRTTRAYGSPSPWYINWCLCGKENSAVSPFYVLVNSGIILGPGWIASFVWARLKGC
jgi:hypothetical protein